MHFKDYLWRRVSESILASSMILIIFLVVIYVGMIVAAKNKQLSSSLKVASFTVQESMNAGQWALTLGHLMSLEENGPIYNIQLSDNRTPQVNLTGPFGEKPFGVGRVCKRTPVADGIKLSGCMILFGYSELVTLLMFVVLAFGLLIVVYKAFSSKIYIFIEKISDDLKSISVEKDFYPNKGDEICEIVLIREYMLKLINEVKEASKAVAFSQMSAQVAHDICSPLMALNVAASDLSSIPEDRRIMIREAVNRIRDIANNLLQYRRSNVIQSDSCSSVPSMVVGMLETILSEKRIQYVSEKTTFNLEVETDANTAFSNINPVEFKRMISNLVNNAVEAIEHDAGHVVVRLAKSQNQLVINIIDNGSGIPESLLSRLHDTQVTFGKKNGNGLGVKHAYTIIKSLGGTMQINSVVGLGTTVSISIPLVEGPEWFVNYIDVSLSKTIVIVDDDKSIHQVWLDRFKTLRKSNSQLKILNFNSGHQFQNWCNEVNNYKNNYLFFIDYEFFGEDVTGFDLIDEFNLNMYAVLVTSRYEEKEIIDKCIEKNIRMLPKFLAPFVSIKVV